MKRDPSPLILATGSAFLIGALFAVLADVATDNDSVDIERLTQELKQSKELAMQSTKEKDGLEVRLKETQASINELQSMVPSLVAMKDEIIQKGVDRANGIELTYSIREMLRETGTEIEIHHIDSFISGLDFAGWSKIHPEARILVCRRIALRLHQNAEHRFIEERARNYFDVVQGASTREPPTASISTSIALLEALAAADKSTDHDN